MNESAAICVKCLDKIVERALSLEQARPGYRKEASGEEFTIVRLITETDLPPLHSRAKASLRNVVGGFDSIIIQKREEAVPVIEQSSRHPGHVRISGQLVHLEAIAHACSERNGFQDKGLPIQTVAPEDIEQSEHPAHLREHPSGKFHCVRTSARMADSFDLSDDVSPTDLPESLVVATVGTEAV
jgi:hypothetical protein